MPRQIPALLAFPESEARAETWGRLLELRPHDLRLSTRARLMRGERVFLTFELPGESFAGLAADVVYARRGADGYVEAVLGLVNAGERVRLARALRRLVTLA